MISFFESASCRPGLRVSAVLLASAVCLTFTGTVRADTTVDFVKDVQPILELNCVRCHNGDHAKAGLRFDNKAAAMKGSTNGPVIVPGEPAKSKLYTATQLPKDDDDHMPPKGQQITPAEGETLKNWIAQGAKWPDGVTLTARKNVVAKAAVDENATVADIVKKIIAAGNPAPGDMKPYTDGISGSTSTNANNGPVSFDMVPIPGGTYMMGSPASEKGRNADEGPQHKVTVSPFWMGKYEVTWDQFELFMYPDSLKPVKDIDAVDAVTHPTKPYVEMSFGMGKAGFPAISMTQHAANTFCKWISAKTGHFYRLPTEAEWEYACRAGTTTAYFFGNDASKLGEYAWYGANSKLPSQSQNQYQLIGLKKPNPWGLYDILGNVSEWCLDEYYPDGYKIVKPDGVTDPWEKANSPYPQVARGGSWMDDDVALLRSAARTFSDPAWKVQDPQLPKSIWYHTDAKFLGFRVVRPLKVPPPEEAIKYWDSGQENE